MPFKDSAPAGVGSRPASSTVAGNVRLRRRAHFRVNGWLQPHRCGDLRVRGQRSWAARTSGHTRAVESSLVASRCHGSTSLARRRRSDGSIASTMFRRSGSSPVPPYGPRDGRNVRGPLPPPPSFSIFSLLLSTHGLSETILPTLLVPLPFPPSFATPISFFLPHWISFILSPPSPHVFLYLLPFLPPSFPPHIPIPPITPSARRQRQGVRDHDGSRSSSTTP